MERALAYLRIVAGKPGGDASGARQATTIRRYARTRHIQIVSEYCDEVVGEENETLGDALHELMDTAARENISLVVVERPESFANDEMVRAVLLAAMNDRRLRVMSAQGDRDLTAIRSDPLQNLARRVFRVYTEGEKIRTTARLRRARNRVRRERGWCEGAKPFGHYPGELETLRRMLQLRRKPRCKPRRSYQKIADILNVEGRCTRFGKNWTRSTVYPLVRRHLAVRSNDRSWCLPL